MKIKLNTKVNTIQIYYSKYQTIFKPKQNIPQNQIYNQHFNFYVSIHGHLHFPSSF